MQQKRWLGSGEGVCVCPGEALSSALSFPAVPLTPLVFARGCDTRGCAQRRCITCAGFTSIDRTPRTRRQRAPQLGLPPAASSPLRLPSNERAPGSGAAGTSSSPAAFRAVGSTAALPCVCSGRVVIPGPRCGPLLPNIERFSDQHQVMLWGEFSPQRFWPVAAWR